jgi:hypothetical protein
MFLFHSATRFAAVKLSFSLNLARIARQANANTSDFGAGIGPTPKLYTARLHRLDCESGQAIDGWFISSRPRLVVQMRHRLASFRRRNPKSEIGISVHRKFSQTPGLVRAGRVEI